MTAQTTTCRDCQRTIDPTNATVPTLCPTCYASHRERIQQKIQSLLANGGGLDEALDEMRTQLLEIGMQRETAERVTDRVRLMVVLNLPYETVANR